MAEPETMADYQALEAQQREWQNISHEYWPRSTACHRLSFAIIKSLEADWMTSDSLTGLTMEQGYTFQALLEQSLHHIILAHDIHPTYKSWCHVCKYRLMIFQSFRVQCPAHGPEQPVIWCKGLYMNEPRYQAILTSGQKKHG